jgi:hypothetical protein
LLSLSLQYTIVFSSMRLSYPIAELLLARTQVITMG